MRAAAGNRNRDQIEPDLSRLDEVSQSRKHAAVQAVDAEVGRLMQAVESVGGVMLVTADHGNADQMYGVDKASGEYTASPHTSHSLNPVPVWLYDPRQSRTLQATPGPMVTGGLAQIGGTVLDLHGLTLPDDYLPSLLSTP